jgi:HD-GYP domain-containing protein (c-di-GMP phosphodiesterase class II)
LRVGQELGLEEVELQNLEVAALLHDIGKVGIPDSILRKPGRLDPEEYALMKKHPEYGWAVLRMLPGFERAALDILHHHESFDGTGYPAGLKGMEIPVVSRIVSVIDAFDAMVSSRPYRKGLPYDEAVRRLNAASGTQFDPLVVKSFLSFAEAEMSPVFAAAGTSVSSAL